MLAGDDFIAGKIPGERIATAISTSSSSGFTTTETIVQTVVAPVVVGRIYRVRFYGLFNSTVAGDNIDVFLRENNALGTILHRCRYDYLGTDINLPVGPEGEFTAAITGDKTFVVTGIRVAGSGTVTRFATATQPSFLYADYIRGP